MIHEEPNKQKLEYKEAQKKRIANLQAGNKDINGCEIVKIYVKANEHVIYEIKTKILTDSFKVYIDTEEEQDVKGVIKNYDEVRSCCAEFKSILYKVNDPDVYRSRASFLVSLAISGKTIEAKEEFIRVINEINEYYSDQFRFRLRYLITALAFVLLNVLLSVWVYISNTFSSFRHIEDFVYIGTSGSIGGFLSISSRLNKTVFEKEITKYKFNIYAVERIFISIFAAFIVYFAIQSNLAFGLIKKMDYPLYGYILFSTVAGFSETFIPNLLIRLESGLPKT